MQTDWTRSHASLPPNHADTQTQRSHFIIPEETKTWIVMWFPYELIFQHLRCKYHLKIIVPETK